MCDKEIKSGGGGESSDSKEIVVSASDKSKDFKDQVSAIKDNIEVTEKEDERKDKQLGVKKEGGKKDKVQGIDMLLAAANVNEKNDKDGKFKQPIRTPNVTNQLH